MLLPTAKSGSVIGVVQAREATWIEVKPDGGAPERYMPRWIGGMPAAGGGLDKEMQAALVDFKTGDRVQLDWTYDERKRVVRISKVE